MQRPLVGTGVADQHRYAVRVAALDQSHVFVAARLAVGTPGGEDTLGPGQVPLPHRRPDDVLDAHGPERMRRLMTHGAQDQARAVGVAEQRRCRAAVGDLEHQDVGIEVHRPVQVLHEHDHTTDPGSLCHLPNLFLPRATPGEP
jgi:hypothetical protein